MELVQLLYFMVQTMSPWQNGGDMVLLSLWLIFLSGLELEGFGGNSLAYGRIFGFFIPTMTKGSLFPLGVFDSWKF